MDWEQTAKQRFDQMIEKVPVFMRPIAAEKVSQKAKSIAEAAGKSQITEHEMVAAFFEATPFGFHGPMKVDMESLGIDYTKYGYAR